MRLKSGFKVSEVFGSEEKTTITLAILKSLPKWFGIESAVTEYAKEVRKFPFFKAENEGKSVGFLALKRHNPHTAEIYVMGVSESCHRTGIGTALVSCAEDFCRAEGVKFLTVKTLDAQAESAAYEKTRKFYENVGFYPLEVFPELWDKKNPCLFMLKPL